MSESIPIADAALARWRGWIGRTEQRNDAVHAATFDAWAATLDRDDALAAVGDDLPPLAHWLFFLPLARQPAPTATRDAAASCRRSNCRAEFIRLKGVVLLQCATPDAVAAEHSFENAIQVARDQGAKSFELRAATSLASLWHEQGKRNEARELLDGVYGWFTEGFDTPDLGRAKSLLDEWAVE